MNAKQMTDEYVHSVPGRSKSLDGCIQAPRCARRTLSQYLSQCGLLNGPDGRPCQEAEDALLVVCELVTNACRHTAGPRHMGMALDGQALVLEVGDRGRTAPRPVPPEEKGASGGFGLDLVDALVDRRTVVSNSRGKTIRVTLPIRRDAASTRPPASVPALGAGERGPGAQSRD